MKVIIDLKYFSLIVYLLVGSITGFTQTDFPKLFMAKIPGAPVLSTPVLVNGENTAPLLAEGYGLAAPAFYDWDGDGLKDLLVGEFGSGIESGKYMGNFIRVFKNIGTEGMPVFNSQFQYAWPSYEMFGNGTPFSVSQFCCMGFTPQFIDINNDGYLDMLSGQYFGEVIVFYGSEKGFLSGITLSQEGRNPREEMKKDSEQQYYWMYSSANMGDINGDGKPDLIVGGLGGLRVSKNIGSATQPIFAKRESLLHTNDSVLKVYQSSDKTKKKSVTAQYFPDGDGKTSPLVTDWDNDGIPDLLVTNSYFYPGESVVDFFKGKKINGEQRFEKGVPLFTAENGKAFPGIAPRIYVCDYNNDGINDLLVGISVVTMHDKFNSAFSWRWESETGLRGITKDPGYMKGKTGEESINILFQQVKLPKEITKKDYITLKHKGYVYVMIGKK